MKLLSIVFCLFPLLVFGQSTNESRFIHGRIIDTSFKQEVPLCQVQIFFEDSLIGGTSSDFDGKFRFPFPTWSNTNDTFLLRFFFAGNGFSEYEFSEPTSEGLTIRIDIDSNLTKQDILNWREDYLRKLPSYGE